MNTENENINNNIDAVQTDAAQALARAESAKKALAGMRQDIAEHKSADIFEDINIPNIQSIVERLNQMEAEAAPLAQKENAAWSLVTENQKQAAAAATIMMQKERDLAMVCQTLDINQKNLKALEYWQDEIHRTAKQKSLTLAAAQKEVEDAYRTLNLAGENLAKSQKLVEKDYAQMELTTNDLSLACEDWQISYDAWNDAKAEAEKNAAALKAIRKQIETLIDDQEKAKSQAAEAVAQLALNSFRQNKDLKDIDIHHLPAHNYTLSANAEFAADKPQDQSVAPIKVGFFEPTETTTEEKMNEQEEFISLNSIPKTDTDKAAAKSQGFWQGEAPRTIDEETEAEKPQKLASALSGETLSNKKKNSFWSYLLCIALAVALALVIRTWGFQVTRVLGDSMVPTLQTNNRLITSHLAYIIGEPKALDIITFPSPDTTDNVPYIKRIIGVAGDHIQITEGKVYVNDILLDEPYINDAETLGDIDTIVPDGQVFVMGDNRAVSHDSRDPSVGFISTDTILGKAVFRLYPFDEWGMLE